ncbi:ArsR/SmtB family transcription factor [Cohnella nanjingensis]|uniref:Winged helix-turn-helix transcriptional regulator n=1 Tax=Cohnella nanjingensis TaxID=1387779 RepID=A0A7X0VJY4_9BACL|nr:metalloregulator ArsR/SmtB family transcription factor [Cohnella nanjingensis]MBB6675219.1 winged helix-turn-helix transcriptional regulator [Cohnella nanjingensis]
MSEAQSERLNHVFRALADPTRREMIRRLARQDLTVSELAMPYQMSLAGASKHVKVLEEAGLVRRTVRGRTHLCRLDPATLASAYEWIRFYEHFWNDQLDALDRELRDLPGEESGL